MKSLNINTSEQQFLTALENHKNLVFKIANSYCKDKEDRKDLIQEIVLQLWKAFPKYDPKYAFSTWIYRIALNVSISFYRKSSKKKSVSFLSMEALIEWTDDNEAEKNTNENLNLLKQLIQEMKEWDKALMILYLEEKSYKEIAEIIGITETNVATRLSRLKQKLKEKFQKINQ